MNEEIARALAVQKALEAAVLENNEEKVQAILDVIQSWQQG